MKKYLPAGVAVFVLFAQPTYASNALKALDSLAYIFFGFAGFGLLGIVFSIVAYRTGKTVWKALAILPTIALFLAGFFVLSFGELPLLGYAIMGLAVGNIIMISARKKKIAKSENVVAP